MSDFVLEPWRNMNPPTPPCPTCAENIKARLKAERDLAKEAEQIDTLIRRHVLKERDGK